MTAKTPKGHRVSVTASHYGTANFEQGRVSFGGIFVASWSDYSKPRTTLKDALAKADEVIDDLGLLQEETVLTN